MKRNRTPFYVITHHFTKDFPINHRTSEVAFITHTLITSIWKNRIISFVHIVNFVDAQGRDFK